MKRRAKSGYMIVNKARPNKALQRTGAIPLIFMSHWYYNIISVGGRALPAPGRVEVRLRGGQSGLLTRTAATESGLLCTRMKS